MAQEFEALAKLVIDGDQVFNMMTMTKRLDAMLQDVMTGEGYAGFSRGPGFIQIDVTKAVPLAGTTFDFAKNVGKTVNVQFFTGGSVYEFQGVVYNEQTQGGATQSAQQTAMIKGPFTEPRAA